MLSFPVNAFFLFIVLLKRIFYNPHKTKSIKAVFGIWLFANKDVVRAIKKKEIDCDIIVDDLNTFYNRDEINYTTSDFVPRLISSKYLIQQFKPYFSFLFALKNYNVFVFDFHGGFLQNTRLKFLEFRILKWFKKKIIMIPYGLDGFDYYNLRPLLLRHALMRSYRHNGNRSHIVSEKIRYYTEMADFIVPSIMHNACLPRWDILPVTYYGVDINVWKSERSNINSSGTLKIFHAPRHRGVKGTEYVIHACKALKEKGHNIELVLWENQPQSSMKKVLEDCDIVIDQLLMGGYAMLAIEAMAMEKPVIAYIDNEMRQLFTEYSYLGECPIVSSTATNLQKNIIDLINDSNKRLELGALGRNYVIKYHSDEAIGKMWSDILNCVMDGNKRDLIDYFHPLNPL